MKKKIRHRKIDIIQAVRDKLTQKYQILASYRIRTRWVWVERHVQKSENNWRQEETLSIPKGLKKYITEWMNILNTTPTNHHWRLLNISSSIKISRIFLRRLEEHLAFPLKCYPVECWTHIQRKCQISSWQMSRATVWTQQMFETS